MSVGQIFSVCCDYPNCPEVLDLAVNIDVLGKRQVDAAAKERGWVVIKQLKGKIHICPEHVKMINELVGEEYELRT